MSSYESPFADRAAVQAIVNNVNSLSTNGVTIDGEVARTRSGAEDLVSRYGSEFEIVRQVPPLYNPFADKFRQQLNTSREVATKVRAQFDSYLNLLRSVSYVATKEDAQLLIADFNNNLAIPNPLIATPLEGFKGVTDRFTHIWTLRNEETGHVVKVLGDATDIPTVVKELVAELVAVQEGIANVQTALRNYASNI